MHYKQNNKESKTYVQGLRSFGNTLPRGVKGILKKRGYNFSEIINKWNILIGNEISNISQPKSIKTSKKDNKGMLILNVKRGDEIVVEYSKKDIINKINSYFGYQLINEIRIQTLNSEIKKNQNRVFPKKLNNNLQKKIDEIKNEKIKNSLSQLLGAIKNE